MTLPLHYQSGLQRDLYPGFPYFYRMTGTTAIIWNDDFLKYDFGPSHPLRSARVEATVDTLKGIGAIDSHLTMVGCGSATTSDLLKVHSTEYIDHVRSRCEEGGLLDRGDTPATEDIFDGAVASVGATLEGTRVIMEGEFDHAFNPSGGFHHAFSDRASGFCVFNDVAIAVRTLQDRYDLDRIAVVDIDAHHADGTQSLFYDETILTISMHRYHPGFFPGTGARTERGEGEGLGYSLNVPMPSSAGDVEYRKAYEEMVVPALEAYDPEMIIHQFGVDGHRDDPLGGLSLTTHGYQWIAERTHQLSHSLCGGNYLVLGGGGYRIDSTKRCWTVMLCTVSRSLTDEGLSQFHDQLHDRDTSDHVDIRDSIEYLQEEVLALLRERRSDFSES